MCLLCQDIFLKNEITPEDLPRTKRKCSLLSETVHSDLLPADAGELCCTAVCRAALTDKKLSL